MKLGIFAALLAVLSIGCTDAERGGWGSLGAKHRVELYSGGEKVREWITTGQPQNEEHSDGYYFVDIESGELVRVTGDLVVTQLK